MENIGPENVMAAVLRERRWLAAGILEIRLHRPAGFSFMPGQFLRFMMHGYQRDYTMVSDAQADSIDLCIAIVEGGRFCGEILNADIGSELQVSGPHGHFIYQGNVNPAVFVATGTGVAPFVAFCRSGVGDALLLHGVSKPDQLIYRELLQPMLSGYAACISQPNDKDGDLSDAYPGHVTQYLEQQLRPGVYDFYLCGRRTMIRDATAIIDRQFGDSRLFIETYD